ncbi:MAG: hypothetical protein RR562_10715 [Longicatena sp.]
MKLHAFESRECFQWAFLWVCGTIGKESVVVNMHPEPKQTSLNQTQEDHLPPSMC